MDLEPEETYVLHPHAPAHLFRPGATYFLTGKTFQGRPYLQAERRRLELLEALRFAGEQRGWTFAAWVVLPNHYHCILQAPVTDASGLSRLVASAHRYTATAWNREDGCAGRTIWYQYWDTCLTSVGGFYARLNYIHHNPVKHGLAVDPEAYAFSSYAFWKGMEEVDLAEVKRGYPWDRLGLE